VWGESVPPPGGGQSSAAGKCSGGSAGGRLVVTGYGKIAAPKPRPVRRRKAARILHTDSQLIAQ
jgi:hypothetical protein